MTNSTITVSGGADDNVGIRNNNYSTAMTALMNVIITASGGTTSYGVLNSAGTTKINHSIIRGSTNTIHVSAGTTLVGNTQLDGGAVSNSATLTCVGAYNGSYVALGTNCL